MYKRLLFLMLAFLPATSFAQLHFGITGGYNLVFAKVNYTNNIATHSGTDGEDAKFKGLNLSVNAGVDLHKLQLGIGVEAGTFKGDMIRYQVHKNDLYKFSNIYGGPYKFIDAAEGEQVASPYITPHVYINFKQDFARIVSVYVGAMGGYMFGSSHLTTDGKLDGLMVGGNLGVQLNLTDRISIDVHEGLRAGFVGKKGDLSPVYTANLDRPVNGDYYYIATDKFTMSFLSTNVGVVFKL